MEPNPFVLVAPAIALLFAVFGWRIAREIPIGDQGRRTWLLLSDLFNMLTLLGLLGACVILPLKSGTFPPVSRAVLAATYVVVCFNPFMIAGHYRLFSRKGRLIYVERGMDFPWLTGQEAVCAVLAVVGAAVAASSAVFGSEDDDARIPWLEIHKLSKDQYVGLGYVSSSDSRRLALEGAPGRVHLYTRPNDEAPVFVDAVVLNKFMIEGARSVGDGRVFDLDPLPDATSNPVLQRTGARPRR